MENTINLSLQMEHAVSNRMVNRFIDGKRRYKMKQCERLEVRVIVLPWQQHTYLLYSRLGNCIEQDMFLTLCTRDTLLLDIIHMSWTFYALDSW